MLSLRIAPSFSHWSSVFNNVQLRIALEITRNAYADSENNPIKRWSAHGSGSRQFSSGANGAISSGKSTGSSTSKKDLAAIGRIL